MSYWGKDKKKKKKDGQGSSSGAKTQRKPAVESLVGETVSDSRSTKQQPQVLKTPEPKKKGGKGAASQKQGSVAPF